MRQRPHSTAVVRGKFASTKARRSGLESTTYLTRQLGRDEKFRNKFGPQYPQPICAKTVPFLVISQSQNLLLYQIVARQTQPLFLPPRAPIAIEL